MPNCELRRCALKGCRNEFRPKREAQVYCKAACRNAAHKRPKKRRLALERVDIPRSVAKGPFSARKSVLLQRPLPPRNRGLCKSADTRSEGPTQPDQLHHS